MSENFFEHLKSFTFFKFYNNLFLSNYSKYSTFNINKNFFISSYLKFNFPNKKVNIFELLKLGEVQHSLIIKTILDPKGDHGFKNEFLKLFFKVFPTEPMKIEDNETWEVTAEKERYDIRIRNIDNTKIIIIENKSNWAEDQENQIYRYWYNGIYIMQQEYTGEKTLFSRIFYLIPFDYKQPTIQSISRPNDANYKNGPDFVPKDVVKNVFFNEHIVKWLEECITKIKEKDINNDFCYFLTQYRDFWRL